MASKLAELAIQARGLISQRTWQWGCLLIFSAELAWLVAFFLSSQFHKASASPLWLDEYVGLLNSARFTGYWDMLSAGVPAQGSPAPLDYVLVKTLDACREPTGYFGLPPTGYYRLVSQFSMVAVVLVAFWFLWRKVRDGDGPHVAQMFLITCGLGAFLFQGVNFQYASEVRPYALWNSLWFLTLVIALFAARHRLALSVCLTLLALSATASAFQIVALGLAQAIVARVNQRSFREICSDGLRVYLVPGLVALFYAAKAPHLGFPVETRAGFWEFWLRSGLEHVPLLVAMALLMWRRETRELAIAPLAMLLLYLLGPCSYASTCVKGFLFSPRHFIYYGLALPVTFLTAALLVGDWLRNKQFLVQASCCLLVCLVAWRTYRSTSKPAYHQAQASLAHPIGWGILSDPDDHLDTVSPRELPGSFVFTSRPDRDSAENMRLLAEWLPVRYPAACIGEDAVLVEPLSGDSRQVTVIGVASDRGDVGSNSMIRVQDGTRSPAAPR